MSIKNLLPFFLFASVCIFGDYSVSCKGVPEKEIWCHFKSIAQLETLKERPPPTPYTLQRRAEGDLPQLLDILHSYGYYDAKLSLSYSGDFPDMHVLISIDAGALYRFGEVAVTEKREDEDYPLSIKVNDVVPGCPARTEFIYDGQEKILQQLACRGYPLAKVVDKRVVVDKESKRVNVNYLFDTGSLCHFGGVTIYGLKKVHKEFICGRILWKTGSIFDPRKVKKTDKYLQDSGLFAIVTIRHANEVDENGLLPMIVTVSELKHRHIGAGVSYSTDESFGGLFQWSHDNFSGYGDTLGVTGEVNEIIKRATLYYAMPDYFGKDRDLIYLAEAKREDAPGFIEREVSFWAKVQQKIGEDTRLSYGARYERLLSTKSDNDENYNLLSTPIQAEWCKANRLVNPSAGINIIYKAIPYQSIVNETFFFIDQEFSVSGYFPISSWTRFILALSAQLGSITGESRFTVPAPKRFYAGSSKGLRGYKFLTVSPLDGTKPIGGKSLAIFQIEPRFQIIDKLYFVTFYEVGNVFEQAFPPFNEKMLQSAGVGIRYVTPVGPLRFDIAFPLNRRKGIDKLFQIYATVGQAF